MLCGTALSWSDLPLDLIESHGLGRRVHERGGEREVRFYWFDFQPVLPVWFEGRLRVLQWGSRSRTSRLPLTGCTKRATVASGWWSALAPEPVRIPATFGVDMGTWYTVKEGIEGLVVRTERGVPVVYALCEPATDYYRLMTRSNWMPALLNQSI